MAQILDKSDVYMFRSAMKKVIEGGSLETFLADMDQQLNKRQGAKTTSSVDTYDYPAIIEKDRKDLKNLLKMSFNAAGKRALKSYEQNKNFYLTAIAKLAFGQQKLSNMLAQLQEHQPRTSDGYTLKSFAIGELMNELQVTGKCQKDFMESFEKLEPQTPQAWKSEKVKSVQSHMRYVQARMKDA